MAEKLLLLNLDARYMGDIILLYFFEVLKFFILKRKNSREEIEEGQDRDSTCHNYLILKGIVSSCPISLSHLFN